MCMFRGSDLTRKNKSQPLRILATKNFFLAVDIKKKVFVYN